MDLNAVDIALDVARLGSFSAVARERNLDRSSVSRAVAALERDLGVRIFHRSSRKMSLTEAGDRYLRRVAAAREEIDRAREEAQNLSTGPQGTLRLTTSLAFALVFLVPLLPEFRRRYPSLKLELLITDEILDLVDNRIDLAIRMGPAIQGDVIAARLFPYEYKVYASPDYLAAHPLGTPADLSTHNCLVYTFPDNRGRWLVRDARGETSHVEIASDTAFSTSLAIRDAALLGMGPALYPDRFVAPQLAAGDLVDVFPDHRFAAHSFDGAAWVVYPSRAFLPNKVRLTIDFLRESLTGATGAASSAAAPAETVSAEPQQR
ncbi:MAG: LysR family transcriptional regulator [Pseudomonadota bacterium]